MARHPPANQDFIGLGAALPGPLVPAVAVAGAAEHLIYPADAEGFATFLARAHRAFMGCGGGTILVWALVGLKACHAFVYPRLKGRGGLSNCSPSPSPFDTGHRQGPDQPVWSRCPQRTL